MYKVLIVEDDVLINELLELNFTNSGYECVTCDNGKNAIEQIKENHFDLALFDVMLPEYDGFEIFEYANKKEIPVIYISAKTDIRSRLKGLKIGAEDYITKPFDILEVLIRAEKVISRTQKSLFDITLCGITVCQETMCVYKNGKEIFLKPMEYKLMMLFIKHPNIIFSREQILKEVWGDKFHVETRTIDNHVAIIRKKLDWSMHIVTAHRIGYKLQTDVQFEK